MVSDEYIEYLMSDTWQNLRSQRLKIDHYKCQRCGRPFDLQVHHLFYPDELGTEDPYRDLITLCDTCHELVEHEKHEFKNSRYMEREAQRKKEEEERQRRVDEMNRIFEENRRKNEEREAEWNRANGLVMEFIRNVSATDISVAGSRTGKDYCNKDVVKAELFKFLREHNAMLAGVTKVQNYFRNRRYEIILRMINEGMTRQEIQGKTGFSYNMVKKVFEKPYAAQAILINEKENYDNE